MYKLAAVSALSSFALGNEALTSIFPSAPVATESITEKNSISSFDVPVEREATFGIGRGIANAVLGSVALGSMGANPYAYQNAYMPPPIYNSYPMYSPYNSYNPYGRWRRLDEKSDSQVKSSPAEVFEVPEVSAEEAASAPILNPGERDAQVYYPYGVPYGYNGMYNGGVYGVPPLISPFLGGPIIGGYGPNYNGPRGRGPRRLEDSDTSQQTGEILATVEVPDNAPVGEAADAEADAIVDERDLFLGSYGPQYYGYGPFQPNIYGSFPHNSGYGYGPGYGRGNGYGNRGGQGHNNGRGGQGHNNGRGYGGRH